jgi:hypothetical protein
MAYLSVRDALFERHLTLRQSYQILVDFITQYHARGESSTLDLVCGASLGPDGTTCDPAQLYDFLRVAGRLLGDDDLRRAAGPA